MAKSSPDGRSMPRVTHATSLMAASFWGSAVYPTDAIAVSRIWRRSATAASRSLQNLPTPCKHSRSRADMASLNADWVAVTAGVRRAARAAVTSVMLTDAKPMPAVTAKAKVIAHAAHPASEVARWRVCQSAAAHDGKTSAARSVATPMAMNNHPAISLDPSDRANQPLVVTPTPASANAAAAKRMEATRCDGVTARNVTVGGGVTGNSANARFADENSAGISNSED